MSDTRSYGERLEDAATAGVLREAPSLHPDWARAIARSCILATLKAIEEPREEVFQAFFDSWYRGTHSDPASVRPYFPEIWKAMLRALSQSIESGK